MTTTPVQTGTYARTYACPRKVKGVSIARSIRSYSRYGRAIRGRPVFEGSANCRLGVKGNRGRRERGRSGRAAISDISP